jgi:hypothetical protein
MCAGAVLLALVVSLAGTADGREGQATYQDLTTLFSEFVAFERPPLKDGAPDYTRAAVAARRKTLATFQSRLAAIVDPAVWPINERIDHALVGALLNGLDFELRVLRPWERDPAFYKSIWTEQSDTPAHEGPTHHAVVELWTYSFPLSSADQAKLEAELRTIPPLLTQARGNLTGNAGDLWRTGTGTMAEQVTDLDALALKLADASATLKSAVREARGSSAAFVSWLEEKSPSKTGPSGIGKDDYNWNLRNVHLVPLTWDDEVAILKRELARAHASLKLEEQRNRNLPPLTAAASADEYRERAEAAVTKYLAFLKANDVLAFRIISTQRCARTSANSCHWIAATSSRSRATTNR